MAPKVSEVEGTYASRFLLLVFRKFIKVIFYFCSRGFARFNWQSFAQLPIFFFWMSSTAYHCWPELWNYIYCFVQPGEARWKDIKHIETHIHTHKHTDTQSAGKYKKKIVVKPRISKSKNNGTYNSISKRLCFFLCQEI